MRKSDFTITQQQVAWRLKFSKLIYVNQCEHLHGIYSMLPDEHEWLFDTGESLLAQVEQGAPSTILYSSLMEDAYALSLALAWKAREMTIAAVWALNQRYLPTAAVAARAALESTSVSIDLAMKHAAMKNKLIALQASGQNGGAEAFDLLKKFEDETVKATWGRRGDTIEKHIRAKNVLSYRDSVLKDAGDNPTFGPEILEMHRHVYDLLSSMAHPSADGHQVYWRFSTVDSSGPSTRVKLAARADFREPFQAERIDAVLWALGWSVAHVIRAWQVLEQERLEAAAGL